MFTAQARVVIACWPHAAPEPAVMAAPADLLADTLAGQPRAARALIDLLYPVVQARVARVLMRSAGGRRGNARQEVDDLIQEVFVSLFE